MLLTISMTITWYVAETYTDLIHWHFVFDTDLNLRFPAHVAYWQLQVWYFFAQHVPMIAVQQIYVCGILCAKVLADNLKQLNTEIEHALTMVQTAQNHIFLGDVEERVWTWHTTQYIRALSFSQKLNQVFSWIFFVIYCADFVTLVGYLSRIASQYNNPDSLSRLPRNCFGAIFFASYGTVFGIYFVKVHENVEDSAL